MKILIVDDDSAVLAALTAVAKAIPGHDVRIAANAHKAHDHATALGGLDLLITDVVMEPVDGFALRAEMAERFPRLQTIFISGYDLSEYSEQIAGAPMLPKPVDADALRQAIADAQAKLAPPAPVPVAKPATVAAVPIGIPTAQPVPPPVPATPKATPVAAPASAVVPAATVPPAPVAPSKAPVAAVQPKAPTPVAPSKAPVAAVPPVAPAPVAPSKAPVAAVPPVAPAPVAPSKAPVAAVPPKAPTPVATPKAPVAAATPSARPGVIPSAAPSAAAAPPPVPAIPKAAAPATARPGSVLAAVPTASGVRMPSAVQPPPAPTAPAPKQPAAPNLSDPLIGVQLGDYRVQELLGTGKWGRVYAATQLSVNRRVGLKILDSELAQEERHRAQFLADARAKAAVQHPFIMSVFEADERNGLAFYTQEFIEGANMAQRIESRSHVDEKTALNVLKVAAEGLQYLWSHNISHSPIDASNIRLGSDNIARLANLATADSDPSVTVASELAAVAGVIRGLLPEEKTSGGLRALLGRMSGGPNPITSWLAVSQAVKALEPKVIPVAAGKIKAADEAAMRAVEAARKAKQRAFYISMGSLGALVIILGFVVWKYLISNARKLDEQVEVPAGSYMVGNPDEGARAQLGAFEIDRYEVSINEYAKFIAWCEKNPDKEHEFDHPRAERRLSHVNSNVKTLILNAYVRGKTVFATDSDPGAPVDLNSPIVGITFWDAYAYAKWRGKILEGGVERDLPTEEEWEAAARGKRGFKYPWGEDSDLGKLNSNQGYNATKPGSTKTDDGYNYWSPVDEFSGDESEFRVRGMAGNVLEWVYRKEGPKEIPLLKGGSFATNPAPMWERILTIPAEDAWFVYPAAMKGKIRMSTDPETPTQFVGDPITPSSRALYIGFRTVKRK